MKKKFSMLLTMLFMVIMALPGWAADVDVYAEGAYTDDDFAVYIYADIADPILSAGVKLTYDESNLTLVSATKNVDVWFLGDKPYMDPDTSTAGEVLIICGKLEEAAPTAGVSGQRVLLGIVKFSRIGTSLDFDLGIGYAHGTGLETDSFKNFVATDGNVLDGSGVGFGSIEVHERGDANGDGIISFADMSKVKQIVSENLYQCFADCNNDGIVSFADMSCIKGKI